MADPKNAGQLLTIGECDELEAAKYGCRPGQCIAVIAFDSPEPLRAIAPAFGKERGVVVMIADETSDVGNRGRRGMSRTDEVGT